MTNGDHIRAIAASDYSLADFIAEVLTCCANVYMLECPKRCPLYDCCFSKDTDNIEDWLKKERAHEE